MCCLLCSTVVFFFFLVVLFFFLFKKTKEEKKRGVTTTTNTARMTFSHWIVLATTMVEVVYLVYMFWLFETTVYFHHPVHFMKQCFEQNKTFDHGVWTSFFKHPYKTGEVKRNYICPFGKRVIIALCVYLIVIRIWYYLVVADQTSAKHVYVTVHSIVLALTFVLSWMNMNAMVYLIPFFMVDVLVLTLLT